MNDFNRPFKVTSAFGAKRFGYSEITLHSGKKDEVEINLLIKNPKSFHFYVGQNAIVTELHKKTDSMVVDNAFKFQGFIDDNHKGYDNENAISFNLHRFRYGRGLDIFNVSDIEVSDKSKYYYGRKMWFTVIFDKD